MIEDGLVAWVLAAYALDAPHQPFCDDLLQKISWQAFTNRRKALVWKTMRHLRMEGERVEPERLLQALGQEASDVGDLADLWGWVGESPPCFVATEYLIPAMRERTHLVGRWRR